AAFGVFAIEPVVTMGGVAIALASTVVESAGAGKSGLETALQGVLIGAGALAVLMSGVLVAFGRRSDAPAPTVAATPAQAGGSVERREDAGGVGEARQVGPRHEQVDVRQRRAHAPGRRLVRRPRLQRVDPDDPVGEAGEARHGGGEDVRVAALEPVRADDDHRAAAAAAPRPGAEVLPQRLSDARPTLPVDDGLGGLPERLVGGTAGAGARQPPPARPEARHPAATPAP